MLSWSSMENSLFVFIDMLQRWGLLSVFRGEKASDTLKTCWNMDTCGCSQVETAQNKTKMIDLVPPEQRIILLNVTFKKCLFFIIYFGFHIKKTFVSVCALILSSLFCVMAELPHCSSNPIAQVPTVPNHQKRVMIYELWGEVMICAQRGVCVCSHRKGEAMEPSPAVPVLVFIQTDV